MNWNTITGIAATVSLFVPVAVILYHKLHEHRSLAALMSTYLITGFYNILSNGWIHAPATFVQNFGIANNLLDTPLMLWSLLFFCPNKHKQKPVLIIIASFLIFEFVALLSIGYNTNLITVVQGPGLLLIIGYAFFLFVRHIKIAVEYSKNAGRAIMLSAILLAYTCYGIAYLFYYLLETPNVDDTFLVYYIATFLSSMIMTAGLLMVRKRLKELKEVRNTRKELAVFFNS